VPVKTLAVDGATPDQPRRSFVGILPRTKVRRHGERRLAGILTGSVDTSPGCSTGPLPEHLFDHLLMMANLHAANRYDRLSSHVEAILGRPPRSLESMVQENREMFSTG
jgi:hypothetical protein